MSADQRRAAEAPAGPGPGGPGRRGGPPRPGGGPRGHGLTMPVAKPKDLKGALRRLAGLLARERLLIGLIVVLAIVSVAFAVDRA